MHLIIACPEEDVIPLCAAVARSYPIYSRKTTISSNRQLAIQILVMRCDRACSLSPSKRDSDGARVTNGQRVTFTNLQPSDIDFLTQMVDSIRNVGMIVDMPCNEMNSDHFINKAIEIGNRLECDIKVIRGEELLEHGLGGIYHVGKCAQNQPGLCILR